ncbi:MAG: glucose/arabinose dehydrogenase/cytochrome c5 [Bacteroidia bacterium]|jgi:glucose/arabinose dehydrogenase/cytochrome c5
MKQGMRSMQDNNLADRKIRSGLQIIGKPMGLAMLFSCLLLTACGDASNSDTGSPSVSPPEGNEGRTEAMAKFGITPKYKGDLTSLSEINVRDASMQRILKPIDYAWSFEFTSDTEILLTQHGGKLLRINLETQEKTSIEGLPDIGSGFTQIGLMDIELHPDFSDNKRIYISYAAPNPQAPTYNQTEVATGILQKNRIVELRTLINTSHYGWAPSNFGGALEFDAEGYLYVTIGDRGNDPLSRAGHRLEGKVLRLNDDGSAPADNPFHDTEGYDPRIFAQGLRNAQGLHYDAPTGLLFESEHGPLGGDEINILEAGQDYGWPTISHGNNYATGKPIGEGTHKEGLQQPLFYFLPSIAASPLTVYRGNMFSEWDGDILVGALKGAHVAKLDFDEGKIKSSRALLSEVGGRIRDIKVAADGSIYILSQTHGLHRLYREPASLPAPVAPGTVAATPAAPPADAPHPGKNYYDIVCSGCHDNGATGAPILGDYARWKPILAQPRELTKERVLNGYNAMPERGLCHVCSDFGLMQMVDYMLEQAQENAGS